MKHKITNFGIQKLLENFTDERSFYLDMNYKISDVMYMKMESTKDALMKKLAIADSARKRVVDEFVREGKATKTSVEGQDEVYKLDVKEEYINELNTRIANILNTEVDVDLDDYTIEEFEDFLGKKKDWKLSVPNRQLINLLCAANG